MLFVCKCTLCNVMVLTLHRLFKSDTDIDSPNFQKAAIKIQLIFSLFVQSIEYKLQGSFH